MKVLQINSVCGIRSTGRICTDIADTLNSFGHESLILYGRFSAPDKYKSVSKKITGELSVKKHALLSRFFDNAGLYSNRATKRAIKIIKEYKPDIIHLHNIHGYYINYKILFDFLRKSSIPVVWTLHDCWAFTGHCSYFSWAGCEKWKTSCQQCSLKKDYPQSVLFDNSKNNFRKKRILFTSVKNMTLVTPSNWLKNVVSQSFFSGVPCVVINNGIDLSEFKPTPSDIKQRFGIENKKVILGVASAWTERKGFSDFIKLSDILSEDYKIVMVGVNDEQKKLLPKSIIAISETANKKELAELYSCAYAFYNPSKEETMGMTTVEALACGTSVIVNNATALPETVNEKCGFVVENGKIEQVLQCLPKIANLKSEDCINHAKEFEKQKSFEKYVDLYSDLLGEKTSNE